MDNRLDALCVCGHKRREHEPPLGEGGYGKEFCRGMDGRKRCRCTSFRSRVAVNAIRDVKAEIQALRDQEDWAALESRSGEWADRLRDAAVLLEG